MLVKKYNICKPGLFYLQTVSPNVTKLMVPVPKIVTTFANRSCCYLVSIHCFFKIIIMVVRLSSLKERLYTIHYRKDTQPLYNSFMYSPTTSFQYLSIPCNAFIACTIMFQISIFLHLKGKQNISTKSHAVGLR